MRQFRRRRSSPRPRGNGEAGVPTTGAQSVLSSPVPAPKCEKRADGVRVSQSTPKCEKRADGVRVSQSTENRGSRRPQEPVVSEMGWPASCSCKACWGGDAISLGPTSPRVLWRFGLGGPGLLLFLAQSPGNPATARKAKGGQTLSISSESESKAELCLRQGPLGEMGRDSFYFVRGDSDFNVM